MALKLAIAGKGGVGKTTIAGVLARLFARASAKVLVIDADPTPNLAPILGIPLNAQPTPLAQELDLIETRTGVRPGASYGKMFRLNPQVDDIADKYAVVGKDDVKLLVLGAIETAGSGCYCPESALLKRLLRHLVLKKNEILLMDFQAGVEHLGRGTARSVGSLLVIVEPSVRAVAVAQRIKSLATELGIRDVRAVLNKVRPEDDITHVRAELERALPVLHEIPYDNSVLAAELDGVSPLDFNEDSEAMNALAELKAKLKQI